MKTMTCEQLGGACSLEFSAGTFEEIATLSKQHGKEMFAQHDAPHLTAMKRMKDLLGSPEKASEWFALKRAEFDALPNHD